MVSKRLTNASLYPVANVGTLMDLGCYGDAKTWASIGSASWANEEHQCRTMHSSSVILNPQKLGPLEEPSRFRKRKILHEELRERAWRGDVLPATGLLVMSFSVNRRDETLPATSSSSVNDFPPPLCCHPGAKAVGCGSALCVRLICAFHDVEILREFC